MSSIAGAKPHAVVIPSPAQGHINATLQLAKLLHTKGFHITFVHTEFNYKRILRTADLSSLSTSDDFRFETIPDGLEPSLEATDEDTSQDIISLGVSVQKNCAIPFKNLIAKLNHPSSGVPPVSCIISDGATSFTLLAAAEFKIPDVFFWSTSACGLMAFLHYQELKQRGIVPEKGEKYLTSGYLDTDLVDWIPGMKNVRLRDIYSFVQATDPEGHLFDFIVVEAQKATEATAIILNTFDELEGPVIDTMSSILPPIYTVGPLNLLCRQIPESPIKSIGSNMWKEDSSCMIWLEEKEPASVLYINFGSLTVMTNHRLIEFAWGLAGSGHDFLWVIRPDLVSGDAAILPEQFLITTRGRGMVASWCPQEEVLLHPAIGGFLTHSGWNSTMESICGGVPMICWPFFGDQPINCRYVCAEWGMGMEVNTDVQREEVEDLIRELMGGEKGKEIRRKTLEWKHSAIRATRPNGPSHVNLERVIKDVLLSHK